MEHVNKVEILKALADDVRLGAVRALARAGGPVPGCEIVGVVRDEHKAVAASYEPPL
jgi:DNA-binding transcriptional ArsR family regulator